MSSQIKNQKYLWTASVFFCRYHDHYISRAVGRGFLAAAFGAFGAFKKQRDTSMYSGDEGATTTNPAQKKCPGGAPRTCGCNPQYYCCVPPSALIPKGVQEGNPDDTLITASCGNTFGYCRVPNDVFWSMQQSGMLVCLCSTQPSTQDGRESLCTANPVRKQ